MTYEEHLAVIAKEREQRIALRDAGHECPVCGEGGIVPLGSESHGAAWWEHRCGAYSGIAKTWEAARMTDWEVVDAETNAAMYPPVGGTHER